MARRRASGRSESEAAERVGEAAGETGEAAEMGVRRARRARHSRRVGVRVRGAEQIGRRVGRVVASTVILSGAGGGVVRVEAAIDY